MIQIASVNCHPAIKKKKKKRDPNAIPPSSHDLLPHFFILLSVFTHYIVLSLSLSSFRPHVDLASPGLHRPPFGLAGISLSSPISLSHLLSQRAKSAGTSPAGSLFPSRFAPS